MDPDEHRWEMGLPKPATGCRRRCRISLYHPGQQPFKAGGTPPPKSGLGGGARNDLNPTGGGNKKSDMPKNACGSQALAESDPNPVVLYIEYQLRYVKTNQQAFGW